MRHDCGDVATITMKNCESSWANMYWKYTDDGEIEMGNGSNCLQVDDSDSSVTGACERTFGRVDLYLA